MVYNFLIKKTSATCAQSEGLVTWNELAGSGLKSEIILDQEL